MKLFLMLCVPLVCGDAKQATTDEHVCGAVLSMKENNTAALQLWTRVLPGRRQQDQMRAQLAAKLQLSADKEQLIRFSPHPTARKPLAINKPAAAATAARDPSPALARTPSPPTARVEPPASVPLAAPAAALASQAAPVPTAVAPAPAPIPAPQVRRGFSYAAALSGAKSTAAAAAAAAAAAGRDEQRRAARARPRERLPPRQPSSSTSLPDV